MSCCLGAGPGGMAQLVERRPCKADVSGSNPLTSSLCVLPALLGSGRKRNRRLFKEKKGGAISSVVERAPDKGEVSGSSPG